MKQILVTAFLSLLAPSAPAEHEAGSDHLRGLGRSSSGGRDSAPAPMPMTSDADDSETDALADDSEGDALAQRRPDPARSLRSSDRRRREDPPVSRVYTYGAPSVVRGPALSHPGGRCLPGLRIYTENFEVRTCSWWERLWCTSGERVTDVDFASQLNVGEGYPHPKTNTLVLRWDEGRRRTEYAYRACRDDEDVGTYAHQWWPPAHLDSDMLPGYNVHNLDEHYERRLLQVPVGVRGPSLEYVSVARCAYEPSYGALRTCLNDYERESSSGLGGVADGGWQPVAYMQHRTEHNLGFLADTDTVYVLKKDVEYGRRKCLIGFQGSDGVSDLSNFVMENADPTSYCGRRGVHRGVKEELWKITHDARYAREIVPALETCHEVTCVGHSLGGALCNVFAMCANLGLESVRGSDDDRMWDDYTSLAWRAPS